MKTRAVEPSDFNEWLAMRKELWPETDESRHRAEMEMMRANPERWAILICVEDGGRFLGFSEVSLREWAEGGLT